MSHWVLSVEGLDESLLHLDSLGWIACTLVQKLSGRRPPANRPKTHSAYLPLIFRDPAPDGEQGLGPTLYNIRATTAPKLVLLKRAEKDCGLSASCLMGKHRSPLAVLLPYHSVLGSAHQPSSRCFFRRSFLQGSSEKLGLGIRPRRTRPQSGKR